MWREGGWARLVVVLGRGGAQLAVAALQLLQPKLLLLRALIVLLRERVAVRAVPRVRRQQVQLGRLHDEPLRAADVPVPHLVEVAEAHPGALDGVQKCALLLRVGGVVALDHPLEEVRRKALAPLGVENQLAADAVGLVDEGLLPEGLVVHLPPEDVAPAVIGVVEADLVAVGELHHADALVREVEAVVAEAHREGEVAVHHVRVVGRLEEETRDRGVVGGLLHVELGPAAVIHLQRLAQDGVERLEEVARGARHARDEARHHQLHALHGVLGRRRLGQEVLRVAALR
mmetsp:Transcript_11359/g.31696  ORF Transcript_11359/g.31696 Transcript_11359/m.31696 type:complete len:288 (-) Transcript_11359:499-1362(-)